MRVQRQVDILKKTSCCLGQFASARVSTGKYGPGGKMPHQDMELFLVMNNANKSVLVSCDGLWIIGCDPGQRDQKPKSRVHEIEGQLGRLKR